MAAVVTVSSLDSLTASVHAVSSVTLAKQHADNMMANSWMTTVISVSQVGGGGGDAAVGGGGGNL
jgi:hypothetical protein